jgi:hypothetical protein
MHLDLATARRYGGFNNLNYPIQLALHTYRYAGIASRASPQDEASINSDPIQISTLLYVTSYIQECFGNKY